ncbi:alpha/beta fold hydrolase [Phytoactinopolyspora halotolerans]|uniref:alpha/beta fold hydrolase n=1 Tax=Phytoactinopolyspora halotolerans TaxID=1981512 RepID=UPI001C206CCB|nr:alpha/beta hydrolase [Phytoactinopolyspora halotolerans]
MTVDGVELCVEAFGDPEDPAVLLISGATAAMDWWDPEFCRRLAAEGRYVTRYDHRDTGRSETSPAGQPSYTGYDLATDPVRVLNALDIPSAHVVGLSMGGGIAQYLAILHPQLVRSLTLIATSPAGLRTDQTELPRMDPRVAAFFSNPAPDPDWNDRDAVVNYLVDAERDFAGSLGYDEEWMRSLATVVVDRSRDVEASVKNHWIADEGRHVEFRLADIGVPTLVLHGTDDPLFPLPHGEALAAEIPDASLIPLEGMGHQVPPPALWDVVVSSIGKHTSRSTTR